MFWLGVGLPGPVPVRALALRTDRQRLRRTREPSMFTPTTGLFGNRLRHESGLYTIPWGMSS